MSATALLPAAGAPAAADDAVLLAGWTRLDEKTLLMIYRALRRRANHALHDDKQVLLGFGGNTDAERLARRLALCREAQRAGALAQFCLDIVSVEVDVENGRDPADATPLLARLVDTGRLQGVTDRARGFGDPLIFRELATVFEATGYVRRGNRVLGTAFLIGRDLAMTAAHVVLRREDANGAVRFDPPPEPDLQVVFPQTPAGEQVAGLDPSDPIPAHAAPFANGQGQLIVGLTAAAEAQLDYAVLRLDRPIQQVRAVSLERVAAPRGEWLTFIIGYAGGTLPRCDAAQGGLPEPVGARVVHKVNAVDGLSGSCCIETPGVPVGLHEGDWKEQVAGEAPRTRNRAVLLAAIRRHIAANHPAALREGGRAAVALHDRGLVQGLTKRGLELAGTAPARAEWIRLCDRILGAAPSGSDAPSWAWHPCFGAQTARADVEEWFAAALLPQAGASHRLVSIEGEPGTGKSFCVERLAARLAEPLRDLLVLRGVAASSALETLAAQLGTGPVDAATRTTPGHVRYDRIDAVVEALARHGGRAREAQPEAPPLFLALDAGEAEATLAAEDWLALLVALAARPWSRIVLCGLSAPTRNRLKAALAGTEATRRLRLPDRRLVHAEADDIRAVLEGWPLPGKAPSFDPADVAAEVDARRLAMGADAALTTCLAALFCIQVMQQGGGA